MWKGFVRYVLLSVGPDYLTSIWINIWEKNVLKISSADPFLCIIAYAYPERGKEVLQQLIFTIAVERDSNILNVWCSKCIWSHVQKQLVIIIQNFMCVSLVLGMVEHCNNSKAEQD